MEFYIILIVSILGLYMAWTIGANDVANSMGCAVGSKAISVKWAILSAGLCEFCGAVLVGSHVTDTVRKGVVATDGNHRIDAQRFHYFEDVRGAINGWLAFFELVFAGQELG